ncbi:hypothetical protein BDV98DRAFT_557797 [Pterulicium gracile]|uniref:Uncharacterized protein n=1 Tax=Pterulicium gracile TaxID=1884261 RepID=A0A5C3QZM9_9AGAR|nr:hypothetical protein BDV98DRAFT_557797 [Pterula gracilis]
MDLQSTQSTTLPNYIPSFGENASNMEPQFTFAYQHPALDSSSEMQDTAAEDLAETSMLAHRVVSAHSNPSPPPSPSPEQSPMDMQLSCLLDPSQPPNIFPLSKDTTPPRSSTSTPTPAFSSIQSPSTPRPTPVLFQETVQMNGQVSTDSERVPMNDMDHMSLVDPPNERAHGAEDEQGKVAVEPNTEAPALPFVAPTMPTNQNMEFGQSPTPFQSTKSGGESSFPAVSKPASAMEEAKLVTPDRGRSEHAGSSNHRQLRSLSPKSSELLLKILPGEPEEQQSMNGRAPRNPTALPQFPSFHKPNPPTEPPMSLRTNSPVRSAPPVRYPSPARYTSPVRPNERSRFPSPSKPPIRFLPPPSATRPTSRPAVPSTPAGPSLPTRAPSTPLTTQSSSTLRLPHGPTLLRTPTAPTPDTKATASRLAPTQERSRSMEPAVKGVPRQHEATSPLTTISEKNDSHVLGMDGSQPSTNLPPPPPSPQKPHISKIAVLKQTQTKSRIPRIGTGPYPRAGPSRLSSRTTTLTKTPNGTAGITKTPRPVLTNDKVSSLPSTGPKVPLGSAARPTASTTLKRKREASSEETAPFSRSTSSSETTRPHSVNAPKPVSSTSQPSAPPADQLMEVDPLSTPDPPPPQPQDSTQPPHDSALTRTPMAAESGIPRSIDPHTQPTSAIPATRRTSRQKRNSPERTQPSSHVVSPKPRRPRNSPDLDSLGGFSNTQLRTLTSTNTVKNEKYAVARIEVEVVRIEGNRPVSPPPKVMTIVQREQSEGQSQRNKRAERRARRDSENPEDSLDLEEEEEAGGWGESGRHVRGAGEEEEYETPERPQRPRKKTKAGDDDTGDRAEERRVRWDRGLLTFTLLDSIQPRTRASRQPVDPGTCCLARKAKLLTLDTLGNLANVEGPLPGLVSQHVVVKKFVYDDDLPPPPAPSRATRSKSKKK